MLYDQNCSREREMEEERSGNIVLLICNMELKLKLPSGLSTRPGHKSKDLNNSAISICPGVLVYVRREDSSFADFFSRY